jgi:hypothetical protein
MPAPKRFKYFLVFFLDTFTGWIEVFPCRTENAEVPKGILKEIILRFRLLWSG